MSYASNSGAARRPMAYGDPQPCQCLSLLWRYDALCPEDAFVVCSGAASPGILLISNHPTPPDHTVQGLTCPGCPLRGSLVSLRLERALVFSSALSAPNEVRWIYPGEQGPSPGRASLPGIDPRKAPCDGARDLHQDEITLDSLQGTSQAGPCRVTLLA